MLFNLKVSTSFLVWRLWIGSSKSTPSFLSNCWLFTLISHVPIHTSLKLYSIKCYLLYHIPNQNFFKSFGLLLLYSYQYHELNTFCICSADECLMTYDPLIYATTSYFFVWISSSCKTLSLPIGITNATKGTTNEILLFYYSSYHNLHL